MVANWTTEITEMLLEGLDRARMGVALYDREDTLVYCNEHYRYIYKSFESVDNIIGRRFQALLDLALQHDEINDVLAQQDPMTWMRKRLEFRRSGTHGYFEQTMDGGRIIHIKERQLLDGAVIEMLTDVTYIKNPAEEESKLAVVR